MKIEFFVAFGTIALLLTFLIYFLTVLIPLIMDGQTYRENQKRAKERITIKKIVCEILDEKGS